MKLRFKEIMKAVKQNSKDRLIKRNKNSRNRNKNNLRMLKWMKCKNKLSKEKF